MFRQYKEGQSTIGKEAQSTNWKSRAKCSWDKNNSLIYSIYDLAISTKRIFSQSVEPHRSGLLEACRDQSKYNDGSRITGRKRKTGETVP